MSIEDTMNMAKQNHIVESIPDNSEQWKQLEDMGFTVIPCKDALGNDFFSDSSFYISKLDLHPTASVFGKSLFHTSLNNPVWSKNE